MKFRKKTAVIEAQPAPDVPGFTEIEQLVTAALTAAKAQHQGVDNMARDLEVVENSLRAQAEVVLNEAAHRAAGLAAVANQIAAMRSHLRRDDVPRIAHGNGKTGPESWPRDGAA